VLSVENIPVIITTCDKYLYCLKYFTHLFNKYWGPQKKVEIYGYSKPNHELPPNFVFRSLGKDRGKNYWCDDLKRTLDNVDSDYLIHMVENEFFTKPINFNILNSHINLINEDSNISKIDLCAKEHWRFKSMPAQIVSEYDGYELIEFLPAYNYRASLRASLWKKSVLRKLAHIIDSDPWSFEINSSRTLRDHKVNDGIFKKDNKFLGTITDGVIYFKDGVNKGKLLHFGSLKGCNGPGFDEKTQKELSLITHSVGAPKVNL
jgi:hypothetical protein